MCPYCDCDQCTLEIRPGQAEWYCQDCGGTWPSSVLEEVEEAA